MNRYESADQAARDDAHDAHVQATIRILQDFIAANPTPGRVKTDAELAAEDAAATRGEHLRDDLHMDDADIQAAENHYEHWLDRIGGSR